MRPKAAHHFRRDGKSVISSEVSQNPNYSRIEDSLYVKLLKIFYLMETIYSPDLDTGE